jgi:vitamin K-dependent gamma-carboxylase
VSGPATGLRARLAQPVDAASTAVFRLMLGGMMALGVVRFYAYGWVDQLYIRPAHHFSYWGLEFVRPFPPPWIHVHLALLFLCAVGVALGAFFRVSALGFFLLFFWLEFSEKATYLNHYYLVTLLAGWMVFLPMADGYSVDARRRGAFRGHVPVWVVWFFRLHLSLVYFQAGAAKLGEDWLVRGQPLTLWLSNMQDVPVFGGVLGLPWVALGMSWAGCAFDLLAGFAMLMPRLRALYYVPIVGFHVATGVLFNIGLFPWLMIGATTLYFEPDWPVRLWTRLRGTPRPLGPAAVRAPGVPMLAAVALYAAFQLLMPWRHLLYGGNVLWHEQGFRWSWRVMLVEKAGDVSFRVVEPSTGKRWVVEPDSMYSVLQVKSMATQPDMILEAAHQVARDMADKGHPDVQVFADAFVAFNGRPMRRLIDPQVNLAAEVDSLRPKRWILPLEDRP